MQQDVTPRERELAASLSSQQLEELMVTMLWPASRVSLESSLSFTQLEELLVSWPISFGLVLETESVELKPL